MGHIGVLISWKELTGTQPTRSLVHEHLAAYALQPVLLGLARLSAQLTTWQNRPDTRAELEATRQMLPTYYPAIKRLTMAQPHRVILTRINILYVAKQALLICETNGQSIATQRDLEKLMACCLMANDLLHERTPRPEDTDIEKAASLLPFANYIPDDSDPLEIARSLLLINEIAPQMNGRPDYRNLTEEFLSGTKLTPQLFSELVFCTAAKFLTNLAKQNTLDGLILTPEYFQHTSIPTDTLATFLKDHTISIDDLQHRARSRAESHDSDFLLFQDRPLIEFASNRYLCIDPGFLLEKAGRSFYWTLHAASPPDRRTHLLGYWASIVEKYAQWLIAMTYQGRGTVTNNPQFPDSKEACDIMIREGSRLVLIEIKASTLTAQAKYSFTPELLWDELLRKAIDGEDGDRKGIAQLHHAIRRFHDGEAIAGITPQEITTIYPVIAFLDRSFTSPYLINLYRERFDRTTLKKRPTTTAPYAITISDLENILPYSHEHGIGDIMDDYYKHNRTPTGTLAFGSFSYANIPLLRRASRGKDVVLERFHQFNSDLERRTFPNAQIPDAAIMG
jgi:hypothetical protein